MGRRPLLARLPIEMPGLSWGFFARGAGRRGAGTRFPQPPVRVWEGGRAGPIVRLDEVLGAGFALLGTGADPRPWLQPGSEALWERLPTRFVAVVAPGAPRPPSAPGLIVVEDVEGALGAWLGRHRARAVAVRPDRYVFGTLGRRDTFTVALEAGLGT